MKLCQPQEIKKEGLIEILSLHRESIVRFPGPQRCKHQEEAYHGGRGNILLHQSYGSCRMYVGPVRVLRSFPIHLDINVAGMTSRYSRAYVFTESRDILIGCLEYY